jgi:DNA-binding beta-propeller fold protein YncE
VNASGVVNGAAAGTTYVRATVGAAKDSAAITVYAGFPFSPIAPTAIAGAPYGMTVAGNTLYVALLFTGKLARIALPSMTLLGTTHVGSSPLDVAVSADGQRAYVTNLGGYVTVVDATNGDSLTTYPVTGEAWRIRVSPNQQQLYVTQNSGSVRVLNRATGALVTTIAATPAANNGLAFSPSGSLLYVSSFDAAQIAEISTTTNAVLRTFPVGGTLQDIVVSPDGNLLYVGDESGKIKVVNAGTGLQTDSIAVTGVFGLGISPGGTWLIATNSAEIAVIDRASRAIVHRFKVDDGPRRVAFDLPFTSIYVSANAVIHTLR